MPKIGKKAGDGDTATGDILWLSPWPSGTSKPMHDIFNHPVMIVAVDTSQDLVCVFIISSLGGKNLADYGSRSIRAVHLPIAPSPAHPDTGELLFLKSSLQLQKNSYIKTKTKYWVPTSLIKHGYHDRGSGKKYKLQTKSLTKVLDAIDADTSIEYAMVSEGAQFSALNGQLADRTPPLAPRGVPFYGSVHQTDSNLHQPAKPLSKTSPTTPLPPAKIVQYPANYTSTSAGGPADFTRHYVRNQERTASRTSPLLPVYAQSRARHSGYSASLGACMLGLFAVLLLVFFLFMAVWIHGLKD